MRFFRSERVQELIQRELAKIMLKEADFGAALVTITEVRADKKLNHAEVRVSVIPTSSSAVALAMLIKQTGHLQFLLMKKINIKPMPQISFALDRGPENAARVEKALLNQ